MRHFVFQVRNVFNMTAKEGRKKSVRVLVAVGNGNGAAGEWGWGWGWGIGRGLALLKTDSYVAGLVFPPGYIF
jgi:ribosomal protein S5